MGFFKVIICVIIIKLIIKLIEFKKILLFSWLPFVSRSLPSDVSKIYKKGCNIRLDSSLSGFEDFKWTNGDISFLFLGDYKIGRSFIFMNNQEKYYQKIKKDLKSNLDDEVDILMVIFKF